VWLDEGGGAGGFFGGRVRFLIFVVFMFEVCFFFFSLVRFLLLILIRTKNDMCSCVAYCSLPSRFVFSGVLFLACLFVCVFCCVWVGLFF